MNRKDADTERPHYYSQYWIAVARQAAGLNGFVPVSVAVTESPPERVPSATIVDLDDDLELDLTPKAPPKAAKPRPQAPTRPTTLKDLSALAAMSFGQETEADTSPFSDEDSPEEVLSKLTGKARPAPADRDADDFDDESLDVEPNEDETASLETLSAEEDFDDEEDEDEQGVRRRTGVPRPKPTRRQPPRRTPTRDF